MPLPAGDAVLIALVAAAAVAGLLAGVLVDRVAGRFPWPAGTRAGALLRPGASAVRWGLVPAGTALLLGLVALRFGPAVELPAFLVLAVAAALLAVVDLQHQLLPDRVVLPSLGLGALLLSAAAAAQGAWASLAGAVLGAVVLFVVFLALALASPGSLGMGDVKLAALLGLYLGWLGWHAVVLGALAAFIVQALVALALLASRRVHRRSALPFGPAMLLGAALVIGWPLR